MAAKEVRFGDDARRPQLAGVNVPPHAGEGTPGPAPCFVVVPSSSKLLYFGQFRT